MATVLVFFQNPLQVLEFLSRQFKAILWMFGKETHRRSYG